MVSLLRKTRLQGPPDLRGRPSRRGTPDRCTLRSAERKASSTMSLWRSTHVKGCRSHWSNPSRQGILLGLEQSVHDIRAWHGKACILGLCQMKLDSARSYCPRWFQIDRLRAIRDRGNLKTIVMAGLQLKIETLIIKQVCALLGI